MHTPHKILLSLIPIAAAAGLALSRLGVALHAAPAPVSKPPSDVGCVAGTSQYIGTQRTIQMSQGVTFTQDDAILKTDAAIAQLDKEYNLMTAEAQGPVHIYDPQDDLTGLHGSIDFTHHLAKLQDSIVLVAKPGKREVNAPDGSPRKQFKDPATLTCTAMTYDYRRKIGKIPGPLTVHQIIQQKDGPLTRTLTADAGVYNGRAETILLVGTVKGQDSDGNVILADTRASGKPVTIGIKEGAEYISVPFRTDGHFKVKPETDDGKDAGDGLDDLPPVPPASPSSPATSAPPAGENTPPAPVATGKH